MSSAQIVTSPIRKSFAKIQSTIKLPNLIEVQSNSFNDLVQLDCLPSERKKIGLESIFKSIFPIEYHDKMSLEYIEYDKADAGKVLEKEFGWQYYGGHHYESIFTRFLASYILVKKFNIDKRKISLSACIRTGKITREEALKQIKNDTYPKDKINEDMEVVLTKLGLSNEEFENIMESPPKSFLDFNTYYPTIRKLRFLIKLACKLKLFPDVFYEKYAKYPFRNK